MNTGPALQALIAILGAVQYELIMKTLIIN